MAPNSVRRIRAVMVTALDYADRRELVRRNVARLTTIPDGTASKRRSLTPDEAAALMRAVQGDRLEALVTVGLTMGLRPGELIGLSWRDVDIEAGVIHPADTQAGEQPARHGRGQVQALAPVAALSTVRP